MRPKKNNGFVSKCCNESMHHKWSISDSENVRSQNNIDDTNVRQQLLDISGYSTGRRPPKNGKISFCEDCINEVKIRYPHLDKVVKDKSSEHAYAERKRKRSESDDDPVDDPVSEIIERIDNLTPPQRAEIAFHIGKLESDDFINNCRRTSLYTYENIIESCDLDRLIKNDNQTVVGFLLGLSNKKFPVDYSHGIQLNFFHMLKTVESIKNFIRPSCLFPLHFNESVLSYTLVGSKLQLKIASQGSPYGSYQSVKKWLKLLADGSEISNFEGDVAVAYDNNQVMQRRWTVELENKFKISVVTMVVFFTFDKSGTLLTQASLKPCQWVNKHIDKSKVINIDKDSEVKRIHNEHLSKFITERMGEVFKSQTCSADGTWSDNIDKMLREKEKEKAFKTCSACGLEYIPKSKRNCQGCGVNMKKFDQSILDIDPNCTFEDKLFRQPRQCEKRVHLDNRQKIRSENAGTTDFRDYKKYSTCETKEKCNVSVDAPIFVNPCSYDSVAIVLVGIGKRAGIEQYGTGNRKWLPVVCDGVPYGLSRMIIKCAYRCSYCCSIVYGLEPYYVHLQKTHGHEKESDPQNEFDWVLLFPGSGHIEMNMVKGFVEFTWDIFWKELCQLMNFKSPKALQCAKKVTDHHKGWTLCRIARDAITDELLVPFVRSVLSSKSEKIEISAAHFLKFVMKSKNVNYVFMADLIFEFLDSVFLYRVGVRSGNLGMIDAGKAKFSKLWYGRSHPLYRELDISDLCQRLKMPPELTDIVRNVLSTNTSGIPYTAEGADFKLESVNKQVQRMLPKNPDGEDWIIACKTHDKIKVMRDTFFASAGVSDPGKPGALREHQNISKEVEAFRCLLRSKSYLTNPQADVPHVSLSGEALSPELIDFCSKARKIRERYIDCLLESDTIAHLNEPKRTFYSESIIYVTEEEKKLLSSIDKKTIAQIKDIIKSSISNLEDNELKDSLEESFKKDIGKSAKKADFIAFYEELCAHLDRESISENTELNDAYQE